MPYLCSFRVVASHTLIMASPPALHRYSLHMASACTVLQCASAELLHASGTPRWARLPRGRTCLLLGACSASLLGRKPLMVASCMGIEHSAHHFSGGQHQHIFSCFLEINLGSSLYCLLTSKQHHAAGLMEQRRMHGRKSGAAFKSHGIVTS